MAKYYYNEKPEVEKELIDLFGIPDPVYDEAMKKCLTVDYEKATTEDLWNIVKYLEPEGYFNGDRMNREFFIAFIKWQRERNRDAGYFFVEDETQNKK